MSKAGQFFGSIILMLCFGISTLYFCCFDVQQIECRIEASQKIKSSTSFETITMPLSEFSYLSHGDELWANGQLYDVKSYTVSNDTVTIIAYHDSKEENLVVNLCEDLDQFCAKHITNRNTHFTHYRTYQSVQDKILVVPFSIVSYHLPHIKASFRPAYCNILAFMASVTTPPPDAVLV